MHYSSSLLFFILFFLILPPPSSAVGIACPPLASFARPLMLPKAIGTTASLPRVPPSLFLSLYLCSMDVAIQEVSDPLHGLLVLLRHQEVVVGGHEHSLAKFVRVEERALSDEAKEPIAIVEVVGVEEGVRKGRVGEEVVWRGCRFNVMHGDGPWWMAVGVVVGGSSKRRNGKKVFWGRKDDVHQWTLQRETL